MSSPHPPLHGTCSSSRNKPPWSKNATSGECLELTDTVGLLATYSSLNENKTQKNFHLALEHFWSTTGRKDLLFTEQLAEGARRSLAASELKQRGCVVSGYHL